MTSEPARKAETVVETFRSCFRSASFPMTAEATTNPTRYPAVGPAMVSLRVPPPAKTLKPIAPRPRYMSWLRPPNVIPSAAPDINTANVCPVIGTGEKGKTIRH